VLAALSMTFGNLAALRQTNIVRMLAYSSIAQGGFMLVPFAAAGIAGADGRTAVAAQAMSAPSHGVAIVTKRKGSFVTEYKNI
jgi:NADH:ubiquinone oxidoreductase subunit 2 (subunit N)